jgi:hypothetical protein
VEADDDGLYVLKFRGAGQGPRALVAEVVAGGIARRLGLPVPELVRVRLDPQLGAAEPDPEIQDLLRASVGLNLGMDFLPESLGYAPGSSTPPPPATAADIVWFDALVTNVDRTARNPNLLVWHGRVWLIDHGAALYLHHAPGHLPDAALRAFPSVAEHVLLPAAGPIGDADDRLAPLLDAAAVEAVLREVPAEWLAEAGDAEARRAEYAEYLTRRLAAPRGFVDEAEAARAAA